jgi:hypothetical protein
MRAFEQSGDKGYLLKDAKDSETVGDYHSAAADYAVLGDKNVPSRHWKKRSPIERVFFSSKPPFDNLSSDPRYADLLRRIGLPQ